MSKPLTNLTNIGISLLILAAASVAIAYHAPLIGCLIVFLAILLIWWFAWKPRERDLKVQQAHERASRLIAEEQERLNTQLASIQIKSGLIKNGSIQAFSLLQHHNIFVPLGQRQVCR